MNEITMSFKCKDTFEVNQMAFAFEIMSAAYEHDVSLFGTTSDLQSLLDNIREWIALYSEQDFYADDEIEALIIQINDILQTLKNIKDEQAS